MKAAEPAQPWPVSRDAWRGTHRAAAISTRPPHV